MSKEFDFFGKNYLFQVNELHYYFFFSLGKLFIILSYALSILHKSFLSSKFLLSLFLSLKLKYSLNLFISFVNLYIFFLFSNKSLNDFSLLLFWQFDNIKIIKSNKIINLRKHIFKINCIC